LDLPEFKSKNEMREAMDYIIRNEVLGFGID